MKLKRRDFLKLIGLSVMAPSLPASEAKAVETPSTRYVDGGVNYLWLNRRTAPFYVRNWTRVGYTMHFKKEN